VQVALINPPHPYLIKPDSQAPLGLMYLAAVLRENGHDAAIVNLSRFSEEEAVEHVPMDAGLFGMTATCVDYPICERLAARIKQRKPDAKVVIGGPHANVAPEYINMNVFDSYCRGEGEQVILQMVDDASNGGLKPDYFGDRIKALDSLPQPARDLMDVIGGDVFARGEHFGDSKVSTVIISSRGCPFKCAFCASRPIWNGTVTRRSVKSVLAEVKAVRDEYGIREFRFSDDTMNLQFDRLRALCDGMRELGVFWRCSVRAALSDYDTFKMMYDSGCREISPGIESADQRVLDFLWKGTKVEDNRNLINWATRAGLHVRVLLMIGTPGEHPDTPEINREFLNSIDYHLVSLTQFRPIPGSAIWREPERFNCRILSRDVEHYNFYFWRKGSNGQRELSPIESVIETDLLTRDELVDNMHRMREYVLETGKCNIG